MKAVVLETRGSFAAVLRDDGVIEKIRRSCRVGETIEMEAQKVISFPKRLGQWTAAAAAALILLTGGGIYGYNHAYAYSYVTLDINPSIEYVLNRKNQVLRVTALNEDADPIVESLHQSGVKRESLTDVIDETTTLLYQESYLGENCDNYILISVTSHGDRQAQSLLEEVGTYYSGYENELTVFVTEATPEEAHRAQELGISTGRFKLAEDIMGREGGTVTQEDMERFSRTPVRELLEEGGTDSVRPLQPMPAETGGASWEPGWETRREEDGELRPEPEEEGFIDSEQSGNRSPETEQLPNGDPVHPDRAASDSDFQEEDPGREPPEAMPTQPQNDPASPPTAVDPSNEQAGSRPISEQDPGTAQQQGPSSDGEFQSGGSQPPSGGSQPQQQVPSTNTNPAMNGSMPESGYGSTGGPSA